MYATVIFVLTPTEPSLLYEWRILVLFFGEKYRSNFIYNVFSGVKELNTYIKGAKAPYFSDNRPSVCHHILAVGKAENTVVVDTVPLTVPAVHSKPCPLWSLGKHLCVK